MTEPGKEVTVPMGHFAIAEEGGTLAVLGLGSCVAVILHDPVAKVAVLGHVLLPSQSLSRDRSNPVRSADTAVPFLVDQLQAHGAERQRIGARLVGGATMFGDLMAAGAMHIGERNVLSCRSGLEGVGVPIVAESVGGNSGRSLWFDVAAGTVTVRSMGREPAIL